MPKSLPTFVSAGPQVLFGFHFVSASLGVQPRTGLAAGIGNDLPPRCMVRQRQHPDFNIQMLSQHFSVSAHAMSAEARKELPFVLFPS